MSNAITLEELMRETERILAENATGATTEEISQETGMSLRRTRRMLKWAIANGLARPTKVIRTDLDMVDRYRPGYIILATAKGKRKKKVDFDKRKKTMVNK